MDKVSSVRTLGFHLNGVAYTLMALLYWGTDIREGDAALQCTTDSTTCWSNNGSAVHIEGAANDG